MRPQAASKSSEKPALAASKSSEKPAQAAAPGNSEVYLYVVCSCDTQDAADPGTVLEGSSWLYPQTAEQHLGWCCNILGTLSLN